MATIIAMIHTAKSDKKGHAGGFHAIAIDLFNRSVATNLDEAKSKSKTLKASEANETNAA